MDQGKVKRREVYWVDLGPAIDSEQGGIRPCLVIQNNKGNRHSPTIIIAPLTTAKYKSKLPTHVAIDKSDFEKMGVKKESQVLLEQIKTRSINYFIVPEGYKTSYIGKLSKEAMKTKIHPAILISLGLEDEDY